jgi:glycosyltransferase involved in cell wall biosynthesis
MSSPPESPIIAIIVPLFAHSVLVADALLSALGQDSPYPYVVIVVNDGCRFAESDLIIKSILALHPDTILYLVQRNSGLSAARNRGIDSAIAKLPALQAVYFLDADNAIQPKTIANAYAELLRHPDASWVYPNIDMFGIRRNFDYGGPYSPLMHTRYNICEAGSLVHRRVFDAGVRFDETMRLGYEDWDFWLSAAARGFRGVHQPYFGFRYRNRAESMLSQSKRDAAEITAYMQRKHRNLLDRRNLARLEAAEAPRYAVIFTESNETLLTAGVSPTADVLSQAAFDELLWRNIVIPSRQHFPPIVVFTTRAVFEELSRAGLIPWALYDCERILETMNFASVTIERSAGLTFASKAGGSTRDCSLLALGRDLLCSIIKDSDTNWIEKIQFPDAPMNVVNRTLTVPQSGPVAPVAGGSVVFAFLLKILSWRGSPYRPAAQKAWIWREISVPSPHALVNVVREACGGEVVYPAAPTGRHIGFVLSIGSFGGVERVAYNVARQFSNAGWQVHLFLLGASRLDLPEEFTGIPASINFIDDDIFRAWDSQNQYHGTSLPAAGSGQAKAVHRMVAALGWLDAVVNCHSGALNAAAASLRKLGVATVTHLHLLDHSPLGRSVGHSMITLAYEHAYDLIVCNSAQLTGWMHAAGIPQEKLLHVPNAPGHSIDETTRTRILAGRRQPLEHLNVLYLGRLDRQKGMDRVARVVERTREQGLPIHWRIVGASVTGDYAAPPSLATLQEPAVYEREALVSLFMWADVMILLSDYEGVPLSVLEAQRAGVVVIATDVGALSEIIDPGRSGFLVGVDTAVEEALDILDLLCHAQGLRRAIAATASMVVEWPEAAAVLVRRVTALVDSTRRRTGPAPVPGVDAFRAAETG